MPEQITALKQNLSQPGKLIVVSKNDIKNWPYEQVDQVLIIADSSNNRYVVLNADTNEFIEQIGTGKMGHVDGNFR